jgi:uncharacterized small protein (DUF1192 family)
MKEEIAATQRELERLESQLEFVFKQVDHAAEAIKNQGLARADSVVDEALVKSHRRLTDTADKILDRITELHKKIAALRLG